MTDTNTDVVLTMDPKTGTFHSWAVDPPEEE